jgi:nitrogen fixation protein FixH
VSRMIRWILAGFALLMGVTIYVANRSYDGLVERHYYRSASMEFTEREAEERAGLSVRLPDRYRAGTSRFAVNVGTGAGPLAGARASLTAMRISGEGEDRTFPLREEVPGTYAAQIVLPFPGRWMFALDVRGGALQVRRRWEAFAEEGPRETPSGDLRGAAGGQEVRLLLSPWPPRAMRRLAFTVELPGYAGAAIPVVDLSMKGMYMGRNRVDLSRDPDGRYRGTGVIVRCPSGRKDWEAAVTVPGKGKAVFRLDVAD